ncbi:MAG: hypothetical protein CL583_10815 [Alteromonadaceae bacterium]|nr:hypothetical protein [Alteromonadaceae bacterium]
MRTKTWLPILLLSFLVAAKAIAVPMEGLYEAVVPVQDTSEARRGQALARALETVLVRVAGSSDVLQRDGVERILANARDLVQSYRYQQSSDRAGPLQMAATFGAVGVTRALTDIGIPVWGANRPAILAWVATQSRDGRELVTADGGGEWTRSMKAAGEARGLPLVLPKYDQAEQSIVGLSDIWGMFMSPIEAASQAYRSDLLGVARIAESGSAFRARWSLRGAGVSLDGTVDGNSPAAVTEAVAAAWAEALAARYAVAPGATGNLQRVDVVISGVDDLAAYAEIRRALGAMEPVSEAAPVRVHPNTLRVRLAFNGELELLQEHLALERRLQQRTKEQVRAARGANPDQDGSSATVSPESPRETYADVVNGAENESAPGSDNLGFMPIPAPGEPISRAPRSQQEREDEENFKSLYPVLYFTWNP